VVNALCVVIRYFGGIKLGAGGLVRAYSQTASLAIHDSGLEPLEAKMRLRVAVEFALLAPVETFLARESVDVIARSFTPDPVFRIALAESRREAFVRRLMNLTAGRAVIRPDDG
jgi:putative IMPACT (imprinted ancient) family translation regulator